MTIRFLLGVFFFIFLTPLSEAQEPPLSLEQYLVHYYQNPAPEKAAGFLKGYVETGEFQKESVRQNGGAVLTSYMFGRIAAMNPALLPDFHRLFENASPDHRGFILNVLQIGGNEETVRFLESKLQDPSYAQTHALIKEALTNGIPIELPVLERDIENSTDLDIRWAEFMVTGKLESVDVILRFLAKEDKLRVLIEARLMKNDDGAKKLSGVLKDRFLIPVSEDGRIVSQGSTDIEIAEKLMDKSAQQPFKQMKELLGLSGEDVNYLAMKGAAAWSLGSNCFQHPKVFDYLLSHVNEGETRVQVDLMTIAAHVLVEMGDIEKAEILFLKIVEKDPFHLAAHQALASMYLSRQDLTAAQLTIEAVRKFNPAAADGIQEEFSFKKLISLESSEKKEGAIPEAKSKLIEFMTLVQSYRSYFQIRSADSQAPGIFWNFSHVKPGRFDVEQISVQEGVADKWISIRDENYMFVGFWVKEPKGAEDAGERKQANAFISMEKYAAMIDGKEPVSYSRFEDEEGEVLCLQFKGVAFPESGFNDAQKDLELFMDASTGRLKKAALRVQGETKGEKVHLLYEQVFLYPNPLKIEAPPLTVNPDSGAGKVG